MLTVADIEPYIESEFGERLEPLGFRRLGQRKWVRSAKLPIREFFSIGALKGGQYCPAWGVSCGFAPSLRNQEFRRQSTDKNAVMDLVIDPIDITGAVPPQTFHFITGFETELPIQAIRECAGHFVPIAAADFDRVLTIADFCEIYLERSQLRYRRFGFYSYVQHQLVEGFVQILTGQRDAGLETIRAFCVAESLDFRDRVLSECIHQAETGRLS
jgi:hypothetical protein